MSRPVISYDDIATPSAPAATQVAAQPVSTTTQPPVKKRKTNQKPVNRRPQQQYPQHWDDPGSSADQMSYDDAPTADNLIAEEGEYEEGEEEEEESRELTHDEIWDDSALVNAWDSAMAEYEAYHGPGKTWKEEPIKKSPLWYNIPPPDSKKVHKKPAASTLTAPATVTLQNGDAEADSAPLNFDTFVPTHDASLAIAAPTSIDGFPPTAPPVVTQAEAFQRAMSAMYWTGYWTAVYHSQRSANTGETGQEDGELGEAEEDEQYEDLVPAQR